jgi:hypothetical protein
MEIKLDSIPKRGQINSRKSLCIFVQAYRLKIVQPEKQRDINNKSLFNKSFLLLKKTKKPTNRAIIVAGICE